MVILVIGFRGLGHHDYYIWEQKRVKMIEKLDRTLRHEIDSGFTISEPVSIGEMQEKVNELVDAVNELQKNVTISKMEKVEIPADPYAEQRWVGHLCKLWTGDSLVRYGILRGIALNRKKTNYPYQALSTSFEHCEPVKPDDDIIYKG